jgi:outer membrane protein OmpA-like peptidoglycan-associated protein
MKFFVLLFSFVSFFYISSTAHAGSDPKDKGKDHPLIDRFPGTYISAYYESQYDEFMVATGPIEPIKAKDQLPPVNRYEGKIISMSYAPKKNNLSVLQVYRNYEKALKKLKLETIFACSNDTECGKKFITQLYWYGDRKRQGKYASFDAPNAHGDRTEYRYWSGKGNIGGKNYIVSLVVKRWMQFPVYVVLDINEVDTLDTDQIAVSISFDSLSNAINNDGKAVLDGLLFDTNKTELNPDSEAAIGVIVEYLKAFPDTRFYVVGHTDSDGEYDFNIRLSQGRAKSVVNELVTSHSIQSSRLIPLGIGPVSPVAKNNSDGGKKLNRRVELVEIK